MSDELLTVTRDIPFGAVFAYRAGDKITREAVEANNWQDYVSEPKKTTAAASAPATKKES